jgi:hypothetical protein
LYFAVFKYPLTIPELYENSAINISEEQFKNELSVLLENDILKQEGDYILSSEMSETEIDKRENGNEEARKIMPVAYKYAKKIAKFPFVEAVCLSGSLSKNYYDKDADIDYFIVTKPNRLWICRTLLTIRYKLLPVSLKKYWCVNYFISSDSLSIPDENAFTGTELAFLIPTVNYTAYKKILQDNHWYKKRFPNKKLPDADNCIELPQPFLKSVSEFFLNGVFGTWLDNKLLEMTLRHWRKKFPDMNKEDFELQFRSRKNVCKRHTKGFQNKVLRIWDEKQHEYENMFRLVIR